MMAPESERATCPHCGRPDYHYHATNCPNTEALTCSEIVERLALCVVLKEETYTVSAWLDRPKAEAILHSWRERRVQELEEALRITSASIAKEMNRFDYEELDGSGAIITAEEVYKQSLEKAREQIRKGAKHESDL